jgi:hypothetical protein
LVLIKPHEAATSSESALFIRVPAAKPGGEHDSTLSSRKPKIRVNLSRRMRGVSPRKKEGQEIMPLIQLLEVLIVVGVLLWLVNRFIPMQGTIKSILNGVVVIAVVLWILNVFGLFHSLSGIHVGKG